VSSYLAARLELFTLCENTLVVVDLFPLLTLTLARLAIQFIHSFASSAWSYELSVAIEEDQVRLGVLVHVRETSIEAYLSQIMSIRS